MPESLLYADYGIAVSVLQGVEVTHENRLCLRSGSSRIRRRACSSESGMPCARNSPAFCSAVGSMLLCLLSPISLQPDWMESILISKAGKGEPKEIREEIPRSSFKTGFSYRNQRVNTKNSVSYV